MADSGRGTGAVAAALMEEVLQPVMYDIPSRTMWQGAGDRESPSGRREPTIVPRQPARRERRSARPDPYLVFG